MTRVTDLATQQLLVNQMMRTQYNLQQSEVQVTSEKKSQVYSGIANNANRVVNLEVTRTLSQRYIDNNDTAGIRLDTAASVIESVEDTIKDFHTQLQDFKAAMSNPPQEDKVETVQKWAFQTLKDLQSYLNTSIDGQYLFSGSKITNQPVDLGLSSLESFQSTYDGQKVTYPTTRDAHLQEFSISNDGTGSGTTADWLVFDRDDAAGTSTISMSAAASANYDFTELSAGSTITVTGTANNNGTYTIASIDSATQITVQSTQLVTPTLTQPELADLHVVDGSTYLHGVTGGLTFTVGGVGAEDTITAANTGAFSNITAGQRITVADSGGGGENDKTFTVKSIDATGTIITLDTVRLEDEGTAGSEADGTLSSSTWYNGNDQDFVHRLNKNRSIDIDFNAIDPAFEKAIRAMAIIAQGDYGTAGGLDQNTDRVDDALYLLEDALSFPTSGTPPFGTEQAGSFEQIAFDIGFMQLRVADSNTDHENFIGFLDTTISDIENVDLLTAITEMQDHSRTLEASYQVFARFQELSLNNYL